MRRPTPLPATPPAIVLAETLSLFVKPLPVSHAWKMKLLVPAMVGTIQLSWNHIDSPQKVVPKPNH